MARWEKLEEYLALHHEEIINGTFVFTVYDFVEESLSSDIIYVQDGSAAIDAYQKKQWEEDSPTQYVINRIAGTNTSRSRWQVLFKSSQDKQIALTWAADFKTRTLRATVPTLRRLRQIDPTTAGQVEIVITQTLQFIEALVGNTNRNGGYHD